MEKEQGIIFLPYIIVDTEPILIEGDLTSKFDIKTRYSINGEFARMKKLKKKN